MAEQTHNLRRLRRRWLARACGWRSAELALAIALALCVAAMAYLLAWGRPNPLWALASAVGAAAGIALLLFALLARRWMSRRVLAWLDGRVGSRMLLATGWELAAADRPLSAVECAVMVRAERLAGERGRFKGVSPRRLDGRWWGLAPLAVAALALTVWIVSRPADARPGAADRSDGRPSAANRADAGPSARQRLLALAAAADRAGLHQDAAAIRRASEDAAERTDAIRAERQRLETNLAAVRPVLSELGRLAAGPAGEALRGVLLEPDKPLTGAMADARAVASAWGRISADERAALADQLAAAADRIADADRELADRLRRVADALRAGRLAAVMAELEAVVRHVQPIARRSRLLADAARVLADALADSPQPTAAPPTLARPADAPPAGAIDPADPLWRQARADALGRLRAAGLTPDRQALVRRYFSTPD